MPIGTPEWHARVARFVGSQAGRRGEDVFEAAGASRHYPDHPKEWCEGYAQGRLELALDAWWADFKKRIVDLVIDRGLLPQRFEDHLNSIDLVTHATVELCQEVSGFLNNPMPSSYGAAGWPARLAAERLIMQALLVRLTFPDERPKKLPEPVLPEIIQTLRKQIMEVGGT